MENNNSFLRCVVSSIINDFSQIDEANTIQSYDINNNCTFFTKQKNPYLLIILIILIIFTFQVILQNLILR